MLTHQFNPSFGLAGYIKHYIVHAHTMTRYSPDLKVLALALLAVEGGFA